MNKLIIISFYYIRIIFLNVIFPFIKKPVYFYSFNQTLGAKETLPPAWW